MDHCGTVQRNYMNKVSWIPIAISLLTLVVATIVTLTVAALHRRQMRQIELHREDPSVPLIPPPHPATQFFNRNAPVILGVAVNLATLIFQLLQTGAITRGQVFSISMSTVGVAYLLLLQEVTRSSARIYGTIDLLIDRLISILNRITDITVH
jgi:hypothetical protein